MMRHLFILFLCAMNLFGCAQVSIQNYSSTPVNLNQKMIQDTIAQLVSLYPPAHTGFYIQPPANDLFGFFLIEGLRKKGYSVDESTSRGNRNAIALHYVVDKSNKSALYHVIVLVGKQSLSRAYQFKNGTLKPLGFWVRKE